MSAITLPILLAGLDRGGDITAVLRFGDKPSDQMCTIARTEKRARTMMYDEVIAAVKRDALTQTKGDRACVMGCADGSVIVVHWNHMIGGYGYSICRPGNRSACNTWSWPTFDLARTAAREHAEQLGGQTWDTTY